MVLKNRIGRGIFFRFTCIILYNSPKRVVHTKHRIRFTNLGSFGKSVSDFLIQDFCSVFCDRRKKLALLMLL